MPCVYMFASIPTLAAAPARLHQAFCNRSAVLIGLVTGNHGSGMGAPPARHSPVDYSCPPCRLQVFVVLFCSAVVGALAVSGIVKL